jgi:hypothetical protein
MKKKIVVTKKYPEKIATKQAKLINKIFLREYKSTIYPEKGRTNKRAIA